MKELIVFDLDGVLVDSKQNMETSWSTVMERKGIDIPFEEYFKHIGKPFEIILMDLGISKNHKSIKNIYDKTSKTNMELIKPFNGICETLLMLQTRSKLAIVTSKSEDRTKMVLKLFPKFDYVCCPSENMKGKPHSDQLEHTIKQCKSTPEKTVYVGDMMVDKQCAENCGVDFIYAEWGYGDLKCKNSIKNHKELLLV